MARTSFLILLLLNLLLLAWIYLSGDARINAGREPQRALAEIAPDKVRILVPPTSDICRAYDVPQTISQEVAKVLADALPEARITVTPLPLSKVFDVVVPGFKDRALAERRLAELRSNGIVRNGEVRSAENDDVLIVLATYSAREVADQALRDLVAKGLRPATIVEGASSETHALVEVRDDAAALQGLSGLAANFKTITAATCLP